MTQGKHAAPRRRAPGKSRRIRRSERINVYDQQTLDIFEAINRPAVALVRQIVAATWQRTRSVRSTQIMAAYLKALAGAR